MKIDRKLIVTEKDFLAQVVKLTKMYGWETYHTWSSLHSAQGYPDLTLVKPPLLIFAELKSEKGKISEFQKKWIQWLKDCGVEVYVWRPSQFDEIVERLKR